MKKLVGGLFKNYEEYLTSEMWNFKRKDFLKLRKYKCAICGGRATQVHHKTYEHICNEPAKDLLALCPACHRKKHKK